MERIKDLSKVILRGDMILAEVQETTSGGIILPDTAKGGFDYLKVIAVGVNVTDVKPGYIVMDIDGSATAYQINDKKFVRTSRQTLGMVIDPENFDMSKKKQSFSKILQ